MKRYVITNIVGNYENECEVYFTRNGRKYRLVTESLWNPLDRDDILPDGYDLYIEGDVEEEWLKLDDECTGINYTSFDEALRDYYKKEQLDQEGGY
jgi:hypothetical protein